MSKAALRTLIIRYLNVFLLLGLALSAGMLWLLANLTREIVISPSLTEFEFGLIDGLYLQANPTARTILHGIDLVGNEGAIVIGALIALLFARQRQWTYLAVWAIAMIGGYLLNTEIKNMVARPRPVFENMLLTEDTFGFPSGHAMTATITYGMLSYFLVIQQRSRQQRMLVLMIAALVVLMIGSSRLFLGLHYFSDVLAGFVAGGIWLATCIIALEALRWQHRTHTAVERENVVSSSR